MAPREKLNVTIVGGGLSGLLAARVLREHHNVTVLERAKENHEIGAGVAIGPGAARIMESLGLERARVGALVSWHTRVFDKDGKHLSTKDLSHLAEKVDGEALVCYRIDLWLELQRLATAPSSELGIGGEPANVKFNVEVASIDTDSGDVRLSDGNIIRSDLVVGADGITSVCRSAVLGHDARVSLPAGTSAFRFMLPGEELQKIQPDLDIFDRQRPVSIDVYLPGDNSKRSIVMYPVSNYKLVNFVCIVPDTIVPRATTASWTAEGTAEELLRCYEDFSPTLKNILSHAANVKLWQIRDQDPLPTYTKGRAMLIGDSAHAMTPHAAQGASQALEDAEGFTLFNDEGVTRDSVPDILRRIDGVRRPRASRVQTGSRNNQSRNTPKDIYDDVLYNFRYPGIRECLRRLDQGLEMIEV